MFNIITYLEFVPETHARTQGYRDSRCNCDWISSQCTMISLQTLAYPDGLYQRAGQSIAIVNVLNQFANVASYDG